MTDQEKPPLPDNLEPQQGGGPSLPGQQAATIWEIEKFGSLNTKADRTAIGEDEFSWIENFMPIGDGNLRALPGEGSPLYTAPGGLEIVYVFFFNILLNRYAAVFLDDGTAVQVNVSTGATTSISSTPGTFYSAGPPALVPDCEQWQSLYLLIASPVSTNGYFIWDGTNLFTAGGIGPEVTIIDGGSNYTGVPTVTAFGGSGSGATFVATVENQTVTSVQVTNPGHSYRVTDTVLLRFTGGGSDDAAAITANISADGGVTSVQVTGQGSKYTGLTRVTFTGGGGSNALGYVTVIGGAVISVTITDPGGGYTSPPTVVFTDDGSSPGSGATATAYVTNGQISSMNVVSGGSGYNGEPTLVIDGDGTGAQAQAIVSAGAITSINMINMGTGYTKATISVTTGNNAAQGTVALMPFGLSGDTIETYQDRVWVANGTKTSYTAAESVNDFSATSGGGTFPSTDSFLRERIVALRQANGFLYLFGDSSINVISNVTSSGSPVITTFNNSNVDPQVGAAWHEAVVPFGRALMFANTSGIYALYGGAAEKVSGPLDGLFEAANFDPTIGAVTGFTITAAGSGYSQTTVGVTIGAPTGSPAVQATATATVVSGHITAINITNPGMGYTSAPTVTITGGHSVLATATSSITMGIVPSAAVATIFGIRVFSFLFATTDKFTNTFRYIMACWDGQKWFIATQVQTPLYIVTQELDSDLTAWMTTGNIIYPMFNLPRASLQKSFQTKLRASPSYVYFKQVNRMYVMARNFASINANIEVGLDTVRPQGTYEPGTPINTQIAPNSFNLNGYTVGVYGVMFGATVTTMSPDLNVVSLSALYDPKYSVNA